MPLRSEHASFRKPHIAAFDSGWSERTLKQLFDLPAPRKSSRHQLFVQPDGIRISMSLLAERRGTPPVVLNGRYQHRDDDRHVPDGRFRPVRPEPRYKGSTDQEQ